MAFDADMAANVEVLNSWKEVATYMGRGVRTVQRWERELGLPVRRPRAKSRSAVIAFKNELDRWLHQAPAEQLKRDHNDQVLREHSERVEHSLNGASPHHYERQAQLHKNTQLLISRTRLMLSRSTDLCEQLNSLRQKIERTIQLTSANGEHSGPRLIEKPGQKPLATAPDGKYHAVAS
jgi:hypothetical protein